MQSAMEASQNFQKQLINSLGNDNNVAGENMNFDPFNISQSFYKAWQELWADPQRTINLHLDLAENYLKIWQNVTDRFVGEQGKESLYDANRKDRRFQDAQWYENPLFDFIRQSYHMNSSWIMNIVNQLKTLSPKDEQKVSFYSKLMLDALAPTNFAATNPEVIRATIESNGSNLIQGMNNLMKDMSHSDGSLQISTADKTAFEVGQNVAVTEGSVVYQNALMQLIQYTPSTKEVHKTPLILMPAWINKYYILDLQPKNSYIKWLVDQGYTVFTISWVNPDERHKDMTFEDYMKLGPLEAIEKVNDICGTKQVNFIGYCLGGTLLACTVSYLKKKLEKSKSAFPINSLTFLTALVDFEEAGDITVFIDEEQIAMLEKRMSEKGYLDGKDMAQTFSMIRSNDMIWSFYINNYLLGKSPFPFDILYWNSDSTRLPAKMHSFYLRNMYQKNALMKKGGVTLDGVPIDLSQNNLPTYILATKQDHIVPWHAAYKATQIYSGDVRFALSGSGHVAGVVNHPDSKKYNYWTNDKLPEDAESWLKNAKENPGSWWVDWNNWCSKLSGGMTPARKIEAKRALEPAPGSYVKKHLQS